MNKPNIVLCGFKGCGKSYFAEQIALKYGYAFIDTDQLIAQDVREFYLKEGEEGFRKKEKEAIASLREIKGAIIATGGGSLIDLESLTLLREIGTVIYLKTQKKELKNRLLQSGIPPFLEKPDFDTAFKQMYKKRKPLYEKAAHFTVNNKRQLWHRIQLELSSVSQPGENLMEKP